MKYVEALLKNKMYLETLTQIKEVEKERFFCKHDFSHLLDVCRIAYIMNLENELGMDKEMIYLSGLLHDIGRGQEYANGISHEKAGVEIATIILEQIQCPKDLMHAVLTEISGHRTKPQDWNLVTRESLFYLADKKARNCFMCAANKDCNWSEDKKTKTIVY